MMPKILAASLKRVGAGSDYTRHYITGSQISASLFYLDPITAHRLRRCLGPRPKPGSAHSYNVVTSLVLHLTQDDLLIYYSKMYSS